MRRTESRSGAGEKWDDRAVSDVIAFILVFAIILSSVAVLSMTGFQAMEDYQETEQLRNAERAMTALSESFNDVIRYDGIEERKGELALREGTVTTGNSGTKLNVSVDGEPIGTKDGFSHLGNDAVDLGEFRYESGSDTIAYDGGAVLRESETGSVVLKDPHLKYSEETDTAMISLVKVDAVNRSIQSSSQLGFEITVTDRTSVVYTDADVAITLEDGPEAWERIVEREGWDSGHDDVDRVVITVVTVDVGQ
ncbi:DUF7289 family protein [Halopiger djelfimassiliensis]|uniref:DUF7289 family protein n=1 Tax=Halopiger djelfimassiliensis TaxID=1293047 RepID=UPI00067832D6|nr:hypothetical protein [Halopiger djelfimassiliensis]